MDLQLFFDNFDVIAAAPNGVKKLRELILQLAVRGKLVPQDPADEPAGKLLERIRGKSKIASIDSEDLFEVPKSWVWTNFDAACTYIQRGKSPSYIIKSDYPVISQKCVRWSGVDFQPVKFIEPDSIKKYGEERFLQTGDILWNSTGAGTLGRAAIYRDDASNYGRVVADSHVTVVRSKITDSNFLHTWIQSPDVQREIENKSSGSTKQIELSTATIKNHPVPIPPLEEQKRIVAKVDELMKLCDTLETQQQENRSHLTQMQKSAIGQLLSAPDADAFAQHWQDIVENFELLFDDVGAIGDLRQAILQLAVQGKLVRQNLADEPVALSLKADSKSPYTSKRSKIEQVLDDCEVEIPSTWQWIRLESICGTIQTGPFGSLLHASDYITGGIPLVNPQNMQDGCIRPSTDKTISETTKKRLIGYVLQRDDIVLARRGEVGRCAVIGEKEAGWLCGTGSLFIRLLPEILPTYIKLFFDAPETRKDLQDASVGSTMNNLNQKILGSMPIGLPPLAEQKRIVAKVNQLMTLCDTLQAHLTQRQQQAIDLAEVAVRQVLDRG